MKPIQVELPGERAARPDWLKIKVPLGTSFARVKGILSDRKLHTVCEESRCPNVHECWNHGTATFMILGEVCTRSCGFCAVTTGRPYTLDHEEPERVAEAVVEMKLRHTVITSVNRDELPDGGSKIFARTVAAIRKRVPECTVEVLIPDFMGDRDAMKTVFDERPDILNHNMETVPRLYREVRPQAKYPRSLDVLEYAKQCGLLTKTGMMLGLGETTEEVLEVMTDLRAINVDVLTLGQYLQPTKTHLPVQRFVHPDEFLAFKEKGLELGFRHVESGPLVRSSYHAERHV